MPDRVLLPPEARPRFSLRTRLTLWVVAIALTIQFVTAMVYWLYQTNAAKRVFNERLLERATSMATEVEAQLPDLSVGELQAIADRELGFIQFDRFGVDVVTSEGRSVVRDAPAWPRAVAAYAVPAIRAAAPRFGELTDPHEAGAAEPAGGTRLVAIPLTGSLGRSYALIVVTSDTFLARQTALVTRVLVIGGVLSLVGSAVSGWFIAGIAVAPFRRLTEAASRLDAQSMSQTFTVDSKNSEVADLAAELDAARARMREAFAAQERFLSNISHEIKTPIATLLVESQTLDRAALPDDALVFVETAEEEMRKLGKLVESFLMLTRVQDGKGLVRLKRYPANELLMDSFEDCLPMAEQHRVRLDPRLLDDAVYIDAAVQGDADLLRTLLNNLIRNAIRFTPQDGKVRITGSVEDARLVVRVADEGPGLPPELLERIFDRFVQSADELRRGRGHGLGLAIAQGIAELHGGRVGVRNLPDRGAEFRAELPLAPAEAPAPAPAADSAPAE